MTTRLLLSVFSGVLACVTTDVVAQEMSTEIQTVKVGFSSPLTGAQAAAGKDNQGGVLLAIERLNARNIVIGGKTIHFVLQAEDDQGDPRSGVGVAQKLVDDKVSVVIGPYNSGVTIPASRIYNDAGIVSLTVASNPTITRQGFNTLYRVAASDKQLGGGMAVYAARELGIKTVALIDDRTAYGQGLANEFAEAAHKYGIRIVSRDYTSDKATDFTAILTSIKSRRPDAIFLGGYAPQGGPLKRQMRQLAMQSVLLGGDGICSAEMGRLAGEALADKTVFCVQGGSIHNKETDGKQFAADYRARFSREAEVYAVSFYDAMMLVASAMQEADSVLPAAYGPVLDKLRYTGVVGNYAFDEQHDLLHSPVTVFTFIRQQPAALTTY
jgi:branched-chain amino acid transport system substrate-binding protein